MSLAVLVWSLAVFLLPNAKMAGIGQELTEQVCDRAARTAARSQNIPLDVLRAITRTETGRVGDKGLTPWPWTVNMEGTGRWFHSRDEALAYVFKHFKTGARSFDVGCFQINFKWHGSAFRSIEEMFDPELNAEYAATFLRQLYSELGSWRAAAGAYHSRTPSYAKVYTTRFDQIRADLGPLSEGDNRSPSLLGESRPLIGGGQSRMGSLVSLGESEARPLFSLVAE